VRLAPHEAILHGVLVLVRGLPPGVPVEATGVWRTVPVLASTLMRDTTFTYTEFGELDVNSNVKTTPSRGCGTGARQ